MGIAADLGYTFPRPNLFQRAMQAFAGTRPGAWFFSKALRHLDTAVARLTGGRQPEKKIDGTDVGEFLLVQGGMPQGADAPRSPIHSPRKNFYYYAGDELQAVRRDSWKLHLAHEYLTSAQPPGKDGKPANFANLKPESMQMSGLRGIASRHGYLVKSIDQSLYNLDDDLGETTDVSRQHPEVVERLLRLAEEARADLGDSLTKRQGSGVRPAGTWKP